MSDTATQAPNEAEKLYDPQIAPFVDRDADEVTQIGPDGKRHPISELAKDEGSDSTVPETPALGAADPGPGETPGGTKTSTAKSQTSSGTKAGSGSE